jgi:GNAT superfamily N-acetyltransferase
LLSFATDGNEVLLADAFTIRSGAPSDHAGACALFDQVDELHSAHLPWRFRTPPTPPRSTSYFEALVNGADSTVLVADAGTVVGIATVEIKRAPDFGVFVPHKWGWLDGLAVADDWRRRGVGTALVRAAERWAAAREAQWLELGVYEFNEAARGFYEAVGYAPLLTRLRKPLGSGNVES